MRLTSLEMQNIMRIDAFFKEFDPNEPVYELTSNGKNAQGKTSVIKGIMALALGKRELPDKMIKDGKNAGFIEAILGEGEESKLVVRLEYKHGREEKITIKRPDGSKYPATPTQLREEFNAHLGFNPLKFVELESLGAKGKKQQVKELLALIGFDYDQHMSDRQAIFDQRTDVNRDKKRLETEYNAIPSVSKDTPKEMVSVADLTQELQEANEIINKTKDMDTEIDDLRFDIRTSRGRIEEYESQIEQLRKKIEKEKSDIGTMEKEVSELETHRKKVVLPDVQSIRDKLENAETVNEAVRQLELKNQKKEERDKYRAESKELTEELDRFDQKIQDALDKADFGVEGLGFDETGVTLNDLPLSQASQAEKIGVGVAIGMAANPKLKVILIEDASLLGDKVYNDLWNMAESKDYQIILETVRQIGEDSAAIHIFDGGIEE